MSERGDQYGDSNKADSELQDEELQGEVSNKSEIQSQSEQQDIEADSEDQQKEDSQQERDKIQVITQPVFQKANDKSERITPPFLTKYQKARVIGVRAMQISKNSPLYLNAQSKDLHHWDPLFIAQKQLSEEKIPFIIRRYLPNSSYEDWSLSQLKSLQ